jgi:hypothetical protein
MKMRVNCITSKHKQIIDLLRDKLDVSFSTTRDISDLLCLPLFWQCSKRANA